MLNRHLRRLCFLALAIAGAGIALGAQTLSQQPKQFIVGLSLDSNYARIEDFLPRLRNSLLKDLPRRQKQVRVVLLDGGPRSAVSAAKTKGCNYLLQLSLLEITGAGVEFSTRTPSLDVSPEEQRERRELQWVRINYRLQSLKGDGLNENGTDYVRFGEYPTAWDANGFETTVMRSATRVAVASLDSLPKQ